MKSNPSTKQRKEICAWCHNPVDRVVDNAEEKLKMGISMQTGKEIYFAMVRKQFRSIDLCNFDYALVRIYKGANPIIKCHGNLELAYGKCVMEDKYNYD